MSQNNRNRSRKNGNNYNSKQISRRKKRRRRIGFNLNIGTIVFFVLFLYITVNCITYIFREKISIYEVVKGESEDIPCIETTGIALRPETVTNSNSTGYVNYYVKNGSKVAVGENLYTIDESGTFSQLLKDATVNDTVLSDTNVSEIKTDIKKFVSEFDSVSFGSSYEFKYALDAKLLECLNLNALDTINQTLTENGGSALTLNKSALAGVIELYTDGYEAVTPETVTKDMFDVSKYSKKTISREKPTESGSPIFKTITDENWKIVIPLTDEQFNDYSETSSVTVFFPTENLQASAGFSEISSADGKYGVLDFKRYMIRFAEKRLIDIHILGDSKEGLKVPKTAVTEKDFYTIPVEYLTSGGDSKSEGFNIEKIDKNGNSQVVFTPVNIIKKDDKVCYIDDSAIKENTIVCQPSASNKYQVGSMSKVKGVYNVNTGLTAFRNVEILSEKNGYYIVESGSKYGLLVYDQIVLNAKMVKDKQVIFN